MNERLTLPVLPLREVVLFPGVAAPIGAGRPGTLRAIEAALATPEKLVFAVSQRENVENVTADVLYTIGTVARIGQMQRGLGGVQLLLHGEHRGIAMRYDREGRLPRRRSCATARRWPPLNPDDPAFVALHREVRTRAAELGQKSGLPEEVVQQVLAGVEDPGRFADLVAGYIDISPAQRQGCSRPSRSRSGCAACWCTCSARSPCSTRRRTSSRRVQEELGDRQREMFLREQLKAIRKELGEDDESRELEELREKLDALDLPEEARKEVDREFGRLGRIGRESMESQVIRTYLETIAELPWNARSEEHLDLAEGGEDPRGGPLRPGRRQGPRARVPRGAPAARRSRTREQAEAAADGRPTARASRGRQPAADDAGRSAGKEDDRPRARSCSSSARPASARPRSPSRSPARWGGSTCASRSAARATRPTSAATAAPTSAPCRAASSRA